MCCTFPTTRTLRQHRGSSSETLAVLRQVHVSGRVHIVTHVQISFCGIDLVLSGNYIMQDLHLNIPVETRESHYS